LGLAGGPFEIFVSAPRFTGPGAYFYRLYSLGRPFNFDLSHGQSEKETSAEDEQA
jgi:hypothetical protein